MRFPTPTAVTLSTTEVPKRERLAWLRDVIGREYVKVEIIPPADGCLFNEMAIHPWEDLRLSVIRSSAISIQRLADEPYQASQDAYFAVVLLSGRYALEQQGREVFLEPGDIAFYDATRPHRIRCPESFSKLIVSIPRALLSNRMAGMEHCTALRIPGHEGLGLVASQFLRCAAGQAGGLNPREFLPLAQPSLDLLTMAAASVRPLDISRFRSRSLSLHRVKDFVERHLADPNLNTTLVTKAVGLSSRYVNDLFEDEGTSLMRYVWQRRLGTYLHSASVSLGMTAGASATSDPSPASPTSVGDMLVSGPSPLFPVASRTSASLPRLPTDDLGQCSITTMR